MTKLEARKVLLTALLKAVLALIDGQDPNAVWSQVVKEVRTNGPQPGDPSEPGRT